MEASLRFAHGLDALAEDAHVVIEAALEDLALKETIFRALGSAAGPETILATNTSALSVSDIAASSGVPERVVGLHFFNPAPVMPLVEVVAGERSDREVVRRASEFATALGKQPVICRDSPGFIVNRVNRPFTLEALRMLEAGEAGVEEIDRAVVSAGYPMGPFAFMDLVGIDVNLAAATAVWDGFDHALRFEPSPIQRQLVADGRLGRKTEIGFYEYVRRPTDPRSLAAGARVGADRAPRSCAGSSWRSSTRRTRPPAREWLNQADIDRALKLGANHPYGPFERAGQLGLRSVVEGLSELESRYGERYRIARTLWDIASI